MTRVYQLQDGVVEGNVVRGAGIEGVFAHDHTRGVLYRANDFRGAAGIDCVDDTHGDGTAGTANTWIEDRGDARPGGICRR